MEFENYVFFLEIFHFLIICKKSMRPKYWNNDSKNYQENNFEDLRTENIKKYWIFFELSNWFYKKKELI